MSSWWKNIDTGWQHSIRGSLLLESGKLDLEIALGISTDPVSKQKAKYYHEITKDMQKNLSSISEGSLRHIQNNLNELTSVRKDIKDLKALQYLNSLEKLVIDNINISDLAPIYHLALKELEIKESSISEDQLLKFKEINPNSIIK
jgi:Leucine-rich repeat (LRR) protein